MGAVWFEVATSFLQVASRLCGHILMALLSRGLEVTGSCHALCNSPRFP